MKVYRLDYATTVSTETDPATTVSKTEWFTSERLAVIRRMELFHSDALVGKKKDAVIYAVDVPTRHADFVGWINQQFLEDWK